MLVLGIHWCTRTSGITRYEKYSYENILSLRALRCVTALLELFHIKVYASSFVDEEVLDSTFSLVSFVCLSRTSVIWGVRQE